MLETALVTCAFIALDVVTGFIQAVANKCVDSSAMREGLWHKCGFLGAMVLAELVECSADIVSLGISVPVFVPVCTFICFTELVSIFENLCKLSPELASSKVADIFNIKVE